MKERKLERTANRGSGPFCVGRPAQQRPKIDPVDDAVLGNLHAGNLRQRFHRFHELHAIVLHEKRQHRTVLAAAEAVIKLLVGAYGKRRRFLVVERAQGLVVLAGLLQREAGVDHIDDIYPGQQIVDEGLWDAAGHQDFRLAMIDARVFNEQRDAGVFANPR